MMKISLSSNWFFTEQGEFRLLWLYLPAVFLHGIFANLQIPVAEIIWDSVFYKSMAFGLYHITSFDLHRHFPVPPLYPLVLIPAFFADSYLTVEWIHSWMNPLLYFLGLYPLYYYSRFLLTPHKSAFVCILFLCYPASVFAQWSMSENLAVPLVFASAYLAARLLFASGREWKPGIFLGIVLAGIVLTRVFLVVYCGAILLWLGYRTLRKRNDPGPILAAYSLFLTLMLAVWWLGGYFSLPGNAVVYADFNRLPLPSLIGHYFTYFFAHWTGLWIDGGLLVLPLFLAIWVFSSLFTHERNVRIREMASMVFFVILVFVVTVAGYYSKRMGIEDWSVSVRYIFYGNLLSLPVVVAFLGQGREWPRKQRNGFMACFVLTVIVCGIGFFLPTVWEKITDNHFYFANAPSLDFLHQIRNEGPWLGILFLGGVTIVCGISGFFSRTLGKGFLLFLTLYFQFCAMDYIYESRERAVREWWADEIHVFCRQLEAGRWRNLPIYCEEEIPYLVPNLYYWLQRRSETFPEEPSNLSKPYLLLTPHTHSSGELVFQSGRLKAYLFARN